MGCLLINPVEWGDLCDVRSFMSVLLVNFTTASMQGLLLNNFALQIADITAGFM